MGFLSKLFGKKEEIKEVLVPGEPFYGQPTYALTDEEEQMIQDVVGNGFTRDTRTSKPEPLHLHFTSFIERHSPTAVTIGKTDLVFLNDIPSNPAKHIREMNVLLKKYDDSILGVVTDEDCELYHNSMELGTIGCPFVAFTYRQGNKIVGEALVLTESSVHSQGEYYTVDVLKEYTRRVLQRLKYINTH